MILILSLTVFIIAAKISSASNNSNKRPPQKITKIISDGHIEANALPTAPSISTLIFSGDVMLSRNVSEKMKKYNDWAWPFKNVSSTLSLADLTIINLESPFTYGGNHLVKTGSFSFNADPRAVAGLLSAGVDLADLANNHVMNQGFKGLNDTENILAANSIAAIGAGANATSAGQPIIKEANGIKFGFLGYAYPADNSVATAQTPGIAGMDIERMAQEIKELKNQADVVIVLMHAGTEYSAQPNKQQINFAHSAIDAGADLVVGHHPHWTQTTEIYSGKPILYSLGNLIFDQMWSIETREGVLAKTSWQGKSLSKIEFIPIIINDYGQASIATSTPIRQEIFKRMGLNQDTLNF